jgi:hypothetical protein
VADGFSSVALRVMQFGKLVIPKYREDFLRVKNLRFRSSDLDGLFEVVLQIYVPRYIEPFDVWFGGAASNALLRLIIIIRITLLPHDFFLKNSCAATFLVAGRLDLQIGDQSGNTA